MVLDVELNKEMVPRVSNQADTGLGPVDVVLTQGRTCTQVSAYRSFQGGRVLLAELTAE